MIMLGLSDILKTHGHFTIVRGLAAPIILSRMLSSMSPAELINSYNFKWVMQGEKEMKVIILAALSLEEAVEQGTKWYS